MRLQRALTLVDLFYIIEKNPLDSSEECSDFVLWGQKNTRGDLRFDEEEGVSLLWSLSIIIIILLFIIYSLLLFRNYYI